MKRILFYGSVNNFSVKEFIEKLDQSEQEGEDLELQINSGGGDVFAGWGLASEVRKSEAIKKITVHGNASSMLAVCLMFYKDVEALTQSKFVLHRASSFFEERQEVKEFLIDINKDMEKIFRSKLDIPKLEEIGKTTMKRFFDMDQPPFDITLNAKQAKSIGLIKKVVNLSPSEVSAINQELIAAYSGNSFFLETPETETETDIKMNLAEFKQKHPEVFAQAQNEAKADSLALAKSEELDRVKAWLAWNEVDPKAVQEGIESGKSITTAEMSQFMAQGFKNGFVASVEGDSAEDTDTEEDEGEDKKEKAKADFEKKVSAQLKTLGALK